MREADLRLVGLLSAGGPWFGYRSSAEGPRLAFLEADGSVRVPPGEPEDRRRELLAVAIAYFEEASGAVPPELEATHGDVAEAVRWLAEREEDAGRREALSRAVDALDDGLGSEAVTGLLREALGDRGDCLALIASRYRGAG